MIMSIVLNHFVYLQNTEIVKRIFPGRSLLQTGGKHPGTCGTIGIE